MQSHNQFNLPKNPELAKQLIENQNEIEKIKVERGWLGKFWGAKSSIPNNIAALTIVLLLITGMSYTFIVYDKKPDEANLSIKDLWAIIIPFVTLSIGYLFGDRKKSSS